jgi:hypothetical protein
VALRLRSGRPTNLGSVNHQFRILIVAISSLALVSACGSGVASVASPGSTMGEVPTTTATADQVSDGGGVTVKATWAGPVSGATFLVALDTHSVNLDALDLADAIVRNDRGEQLTGAAWDAPKGGHHRSGRLTFQGLTAPFLTGARWIELVIRGVGDLPERVLHWDLGT